jgi:cell division protein FtsW (lipid II flippase)
MIEQGAFRKLTDRLPMAIMVPMIMIVAIGIVNLSSAAQATRPDLYISQLSKFGLAFTIMFALGVIHTRYLRRISFLVYIGALLLLFLVLIIGTSVKGSQRWLVYGAFRLQPSDPAKVALILAMARYCSLYWPAQGYSLITLVRPLNISRPLALIGLMIFLLVKDRHNSLIFSHHFLTSKVGIVLMVTLIAVLIIWFFIAAVRTFKERLHLTSIIAPLDVPLLPFLLVYVEPDLGTSVIILSIAGLIFLFIGIKRMSLILGIMSLLVVSVGAYFTVLKDYQKQRLVSFLNPEADLQGDGYQAMQSIIAIGSGQLLGKGYKEGTQTQLSFLPENSTDYIFSVWAEEWGLAACYFLLLLYFLLIKGILNLSARVEDKFSKLICVGVAANIFIHVLINIGMVTGLMPVVGVPLVLMSYGGSALTTTMIGLGLVLNVALWRGAH